MVSHDKSKILLYIFCILEKGFGFCLYRKFSFLQLLFVLFACLHLQTQVQGKPYKSQEAQEQRFTEDLHESTQAMKNETSSVRGKRGVIYSLTDICSPPSYFPPKSAYGCVKGRYSCYSHVEFVCNTLSFQCLSNVAQYTYPKCIPDFHVVTIDLGTGGKIKAKRTRGCHC